MWAEPELPPSDAARVVNGGSDYRSVEVRIAPAEYYNGGVGSVNDSITCELPYTPDNGSRQKDWIIELLGNVHKRRFYGSQTTRRKGALGTAPLLLRCEAYGSRQTYVGVELHEPVQFEPPPPLPPPVTRFLTAASSGVPEWSPLL